MFIIPEFIRLPLTFDAQRLAEEIAAFGENDWRPHPEGHPGNSALPLISVDGDPSNDDVRGAMQPTPHLGRCPYLRQVLAAFGDARTITNPCHSASFLDENVGWLANSNLFGTTIDGGVTWTMQALPESAHKIATIDTYGSGEGYLLDQYGVLFFTQDDGAHWRETSRLDLGDLKMSFSAYQLAAMRFTDSQHGLIVVSPTDKAKPEPVLAFHTSDGGATWTSEVVPVVAGPVYLARDGKLLTVISGVNQLTLLRYDE